MPPRKSQHSLAKLGKVGRKPFLPLFKDWKKACELYVYDQQIFKHFDICRETFYGFLDNQRYLKEQGKKADYLDIYLIGRNKSKEWAISTLKNAAVNGDSAAIIFSSKAIGGLLEAKDISHIELKKLELELKSKSFLSELAKKFELNSEQLEKFAFEYFKPINLD